MNRKIGFTFSGGGARAIAQIGILKAFEEYGIKADVVAGTSGGAIIAALYAAGLSTEQMLQAASEGDLFKAYRMGSPFKGLTNLEYLKEILSKHIGTDSFEQLALPLFVTATDLNEGAVTYFSSGSLFTAVMASCSIPFLFKPVEINGKLYVDGGIIDNMPVAPLQAHCDIIIGINVTPNYTLSKKALENVVSISKRTFDIIATYHSVRQKSKCTFVIEPKDVLAYSIFNFKAYQALHEIGYQAALKQMPQLFERLPSSIDYTTSQTIEVS